MSSSSSSQIQIIFPQDGEAWSALSRRLKETEGELLVILSGREAELIAQPDVRKNFLAECKKMHTRLRMATKHPAVAAEARGMGIRVLDRTKHVRALLHGHPKLNDALRVFSPQLWRQQLKSRLQRMGLLSVPKIRIFSLAGLSLVLFYVVVFKLLPSADVYVRPRQEAVSQTINIFLVQSGASIGGTSARVRRMPLRPITVRSRKKMDFDHISKEFIGTSATVDLTIINKSDEEYALRSGTRFTNQAGMVFKIQSHAIIESGKEVTVRAKADDTDLYGQIIGDRGNVPAGLKWEIPGLSVEERALVYAENRTAAKGGTTGYRTVMRQEDLELARKRLEQELLNTAKAAAEAERAEYNNSSRGEHLELLNYPELISVQYGEFVLPQEYLGQVVQSVPVEGSITYTIFAYDSEEILQMLLKELHDHVREGRRLVDDHLGREHLVAHVIDYADNRGWIKLTVDLNATEEHILDPLSPTGALFGKKVRELIAGKPRDEALRVLRNLPEVERVEIRQWPPWNRTLPGIPSHISVIPD